MKTTRAFVLLSTVVLTVFAENGITFEQAQARSAALRAEIAHHDELYFRQAAPEITDAQYDSLKRELTLLAQEFPGLDAAPLIGDDRTSGFSRYRHRSPMLSLHKSHTEAEVKDFVQHLNGQLGRGDLAYVVEPKYDGLGISVTYEKGRLVRAVTRGNGVEGDDVTSNLLRLAALPQRLSASGRTIPDVVELRGEVFMTYAEFKRINGERETAAEESYGHPRNLAVGTLKQQDDSGPGRTLSVVFYGVGAVLPASREPRSQQELHACIKAWGLPGVTNFKVVRGPGEVWAAVDALGRHRAELSFPMDGAVVKLDDLRLQAALGATAEAPRGAIAYKYPPESVATRLNAIVLQVGRTGVVAPVAELEPVTIGGATVRRATLHNRVAIARQDLRVGDWVFLERAGEIIPAITGVDLGRRPATAVPFTYPEECPSCHTQLVAEGAAVRCPNRRCAAQVRRRLEHFVSDGAVNINGFGKALIASLVQRGLVEEPADLFALAEAQLTRVTGRKTADKLLKALSAGKARERWRFIYGLGVPGVGPAGARTIAKQFPDLRAWINAREQDYRGGGVSAAARRASLAFFADDGNRQAGEALDRVIAGRR